MSGSEGGDGGGQTSAITVIRRETYRTFHDGLRVALSTPGVILLASSAGFGALSDDAGMSLFNALLMMGTFFALPAQVVMMDQLTRGGSILAGAAAVALTGVRLVPMVVTILPWLTDDRPAVWRRALAIHAVAITGWLEGHRILPSVEEGRRTQVFLGIGTGLILTTQLGTLLGFVLAGSVSPILAGVLLFLTPIYFLLSLMAASRRTMDWLSIMIGSLMGPAIYVIAPGFDLLLTGLIGGTLAYVVGSRFDALFAAADEEADE